MGFRLAPTTTASRRLLLLLVPRPLNTTFAGGIISFFVLFIMRIPFPVDDEEVGGPSRGTAVETAAMASCGINRSSTEEQKSAWVIHEDEPRTEGDCTRSNVEVSYIK